MVINMRSTNVEKQGLRQLTNFIPQDAVFAEIGCYAGLSSEIFMQSNRVSTLYCIDAWTSGYDERDGASRSDMAEVEEAFDKRMRGHNIIKIKAWSYDAVNQFEDESLDGIYIDGNHGYEAVKKDIELFLPKIKKTGIICGHDYNSPGWGKEVNRAVNEVLGIPDLTFNDYSWLFYMDKRD